ncbi:MAG: sensor histidine kinase [Lachnospirales bacterium]
MLVIVLNNVFFVMVLVIFSLHLCTNAYNELLYKAVAENLTQSAYTISDSLNSIVNMSSSIIAAPEIQTSLSNIIRMNDRVAWTNANRIINNSLQTYYSSVRGNGASFMMIQNKYFNNSTYIVWRNKLSEERFQAAIDAAASKEGAAAWIPADPGSNALLISREIREIDHLSLAPLGTLIVYVDLNNIIEKATAAANQYSDSRYVLCSGKQRIYMPEGFPDPLADKLISSSSQKYQILKLKGHTYFTVHNTIPGYNMDYYGLVPYDEVMGTLKTTLLSSFLSLFAGVCFIIVISNILIRSILRHFQILLQKMDQFSQDEAALLSTKYDSEYAHRKDEIGRLHQGFEQMTKRIQNLVNTNYVNELLARDAQIKALESQINPHFLYNTLESINWRAKAVNNREISLMTESLGTLLRATLSNKQSLVTLAYERNLIQSYITIQQIRFEERLDYKAEIPDELNDALLPPLTLQPLVENAIHYALEEITETCYITVQAAIQEEAGENRERCIRISVTNSGSSFDDNLLELLKQNRKQPTRSGIGLLNIDKRIKLLFGEHYGLSLSNQEDCAVASVTIPYRKENSISC